MLIVTILAAMLAGVLGLGWLVPFIMGIVYLRRRTGGTVLTVLGGIWLLGVVAIVALAALTARQVRRSFATSPKVEQFDATKYTGPTGTIALTYKGRSRLEVYQHEQRKRLRLSTDDGTIKAPVAIYSVLSYEAIAKDAKRAQWVATYRPDSLKAAVSAGATTKLDLGPPLTASITVKKAPNDSVTMDFSLTGATAGQYTITKAHGVRVAPSFVALDQSGRTVWRGRFEYG